MSEVTLYRFGPLLDQPDASPFCIKVMTWLRLANVPHTLRYGSARSAPHGKLPYIRHGDTTVADSSLIIRHLTAAFNITLDEGMTPQDIAIARAFQSMIEEHLYFVLIYFRWLDPQAWEDGFGDAITQLIRKAKIPGLLVPAIVRLARRQAIKGVTNQGVGRLPREEVIALGAQLVDAIAAQIGDQDFVLGDTLRTIDATVYAFLACILTPLPTPIRDHAKQHANLVAYCDRVHTHAFADNP